MSKLAELKVIILEILSDGKEHSSIELKKEIRNRGIDIDDTSSTFRTAMYQLKNSNMNIESKERGVYYLTRDTENSRLKGFMVLKPSKRVARKCVYIHEDGKIILNGALNSEIGRRDIEIRIADFGEKIALIVGGEESHRFTKSGRTKNPEILKMYGKRKVNFPIGYNMENIEGIWIGKIRKEK